MVAKLPYLKRRPLRALEKTWVRGEAFFNRWSTSKYNPLYHVGTLTIFLLIVIAVTGVYLTVFYRPGTERAFETVAWMSSTWLGSLLRSIHRYASDALMVTALLHALKSFLNDSFWGSRWLAWVSGWVLLALFWVIGVMGYWLVWDQGAQWITEYAIELLGGPVAMTFISPEAASKAFMFFVIVLFLHVFLSLLVILGVLIHVMRMQRVRLWSPRWLMIGTTAILAVFALIAPVSSTLPADLSRLVGVLKIDGWYLGYLPLATRWGTPVFWGFSILLFSVLTAFPWLLRGRSVGPAIINEELCTGCTYCALQCPYGVIEMVARKGDGAGQAVAVVQPDLCTGCGVCVGACPTEGINLLELTISMLMDGLKRSLADRRAAGVAPAVIFSCQRHTAAGELSADQEGVLTCSLPCAGMLHAKWVRECLDEGARSVVVLSCPSDDCAFREGPQWLDERLGRLQRRKSLRGRVHWLEAAPGDHRRLVSLLGGSDQEEAGERRKIKGFKLISSRHAFPSVAIGLLLVSLLFGFSLIPHWTVAASPPDQGMLRLEITHGGKLIATSATLPPEIQAKLPQGVSPEQVLGAERFPVRVRVQIDDAPVTEHTYKPSGLREEGIIYGVEMFWLPPGQHQVRVWLMDDGVNWREVFADVIEIRSGFVQTLDYDQKRGVFTLP